MRVQLRGVAVTLTALIGLWVSPAVASARAELPAPAPLLELTTTGDGHFYTLSQNEADTAVSRFGFNPMPAPAAYMWKSVFPGSQVVFRLRWKQRSSYLVTPSPSERDSLVNSGRFVYEGILGYAGAPPNPPAPGMTVLWRYSKNGDWPLALDSSPAEAEFKRQGYHRDGRVGYVYASPPPGSPPPQPPGTEPPPGTGPPPTTKPPTAKPRQSMKLRRAIRRCQRKYRGSRPATKRARQRCIRQARKKYARK